MSSYISHFRSWALALLVLFGIEATVQAVAHPSPYDTTNFLQFSFGAPETPQRLFMYHKFKAFADSRPTIVQSGDSSGFYGIEPAVVERHLPPGTTYLNMSCCANLGFNGYYNTMKFMAEHDPDLKYMVLHFTPYTMPIPEMWDRDGAALWGPPDITVFGDAVNLEYLSFWRIFHLPSMAFRRQVTDYLFYLAGRFNRLDRPLLDNVNYFEFLKVFEQTKGWMRESDPRNGVAATECEIPTPSYFDFRSFRQKSYLEGVLDAFAGLAQHYGARLVVVFQPVACTLGTGARNAEARAIIERFKQAHPEVEIPFPLIETWPADMFSVPAHVRWEYTDRLGDRLGTAMAEILARHGDASATSDAAQ